MCHCNNAPDFHVPKNPDEVKRWINSIPMYKDDHPNDLSFKDRQEILDVQNAKLIQQMERLEKFSPFYREKFKEWGLDRAIH